MLTFRQYLIAEDYARSLEEVGNPIIRNGRVVGQLPEEVVIEKGSQISAAQPWESLVTQKELNSLPVEMSGGPKEDGDCKGPRVERLREAYAEIYKNAVHEEAKLNAILIHVSKGKGLAGNIKPLVGIKSFGSLVDKVIKRGKPIEKVTDMVRGAVPCGDDEEVQKVVKMILRTQKVVEYETKDKGDDKFGYYGSHHFLIKVDQFVCEVQVMTKRLWTYKEWGHQFYNNYRGKPSEVPTSVARKSQAVFALGNRPAPMQRRLHYQS